MTEALPEAAVSHGAAIRARGVGIRFDFDRRHRVVTKTLAYVRKVRVTAWGLRDVDLEFGPGSGVALVGPTGSGKTTLLRVLAGVLLPDTGELEVRGNVGSLLSTGAGVGALLTGRENALLLAVLAGLPLREARRSMDAIADRAKLGDAFERPVHTYSEGMRARLHFAVIQAISPRVVLLDEVFEALDHEFRALVEEYARGIRSSGGIVVAAGPDHEALSRICESAVLLERGHVRASGPFDEMIRTYRPDA
jgi:ABC-type polysaccharide/polyol phosphate transport system ATPase subunit